MSLIQFKVELETAKQKLKTVESSINKKNIELASLKENEEKEKELVRLLSHCILEFSKTTKFLEKFVTSGMNALYPNNYEVNFPFTFDSSQNPTGLSFTVTKNKVLLSDPKEDLGDGEYTSFVFFIFLGCFLKITSKNNRVLNLDEPAPQLDSKAWKSLGKVLLEICKEFNCQINMTTHISDPIGKTFVMHNGAVKEILYDSTN